MLPMMDGVDEYVFAHSAKPSRLLDELQEFTRRDTKAPGMLTGPIEGQFLKMLIQVAGAKRVIEVGMFTGYATLSMAEGLPEDGQISTCELEPKHIEIATSFFARSPYRERITILPGPALDSLQKLQPQFDFMFIDADKVNYGNYYEEGMRLVRSEGLICIDNALWSGKVLHPQDAATSAIDTLNQKISQDDRVESVLLTVRDGIHLVRKK